MECIIDQQIPRLTVYLKSMDKFFSLLITKILQLRYFLKKYYFCLHILCKLNSFSCLSVCSGSISITAMCFLPLCLDKIAKFYIIHVLLKLNCPKSIKLKERKKEKGKLFGFSFPCNKSPLLFWMLEHCSNYIYIQSYIVKGVYFFASE